MTLHTECKVKRYSETRSFKSSIIDFPEWFYWKDRQEKLKLQEEINNPDYLFSLGFGNGLDYNTAYIIAKLDAGNEMVNCIEFVVDYYIKKVNKSYMSNRTESFNDTILEAFINKSGKLSLSNIDFNVLDSLWINDTLWISLLARMNRDTLFQDLNNEIIPYSSAKFINLYKNKKMELDSIQKTF